MAQRKSVRNPSSPCEFVRCVDRLTGSHAPGNTRKIGSGSLRHRGGRRSGEPTRRIGLVFEASEAVVPAAAASVSDRLADPVRRHRRGVGLDQSISSRIRGSPDKARAYTAALAINLLLNGSWTWLFFNRRKLGASAVVAAALTASSADLTRRAVEARSNRACTADSVSAVVCVRDAAFDPDLVVEPLTVSTVVTWPNGQVRAKPNTRKTKRNGNA